jgi:tetratricopeptide (TPR) repeat protein
VNSLNNAALNRNEDPEVMYSLGLENMLQRNLGAAFDNAIVCSEMMAGNTVKGWKLLALVVSAEQRFRDAQTVVEFALDAAEKIEQFELLRLKALLQIAQEQPKQAIETYRILLSLIQAQRDIQAKNPEQAHILKSEVSSYMPCHLSCMKSLIRLKINLEEFKKHKCLKFSIVYQVLDKHSLYHKSKLGRSISCHFKINFTSSKDARILGN